jgi:spore coat protein U-like protein
VDLPTFSFDVTATVLGTCATASAGGDLTFGTYSGSDISATTTISVTCTTGVTYYVALNDGLNFAHSSHRSMTDGSGNYLEYELYKEAGHSTRWGSSGTDRVAGSGSGLPQTLTVYGLLPGGQALTTGSYSDTITVTVSYQPL